MPISRRSSEEVDISLVSGGVYRKLATGISEDEIQSGPSNQVSMYHQNSLSTAMLSREYLAQRSWSGLEPRVGEDSVTKAALGRKGTASGYEHEGAKDGINE